MKRILFLLVFFPFFIQAQSSLEFGVMIGASTYQGDLSPTQKGLDTSPLHPALGFFARYNANPFLGLKAGFTYGRISGDDALAQDESQLNRNLSFESVITELSVIGEWNILGYEAGIAGKRFSPYLFGGVALYHFNPEANYNGKLVELQPLGTEGQGMEGFPKPYKRSEVSLPFGAGIKFSITNQVTIGLEAGLRKTFTDYIDDVSGTYVNYDQLRIGNGELAALLGNRTGEYLGTNEPPKIGNDTLRGNPNDDDWYFVSGLTITYKFAGSNGGLGRGSKGRTGGRAFGCPKFTGR